MSLVSTRVMVLMDARSPGLRHRWHPRRGLQIFSDASRHGRAKHPIKEGIALCGTVKTYPERQEVEVTLSCKAPNELTLDLFSLFLGWGQVRFPGGLWEGRMKRVSS
jgi:hypothetical protein